MTCSTHVHQGSWMQPNAHPLVHCVHRTHGRHPQMVSPEISQPINVPYTVQRILGTRRHTQACRNNHEGLCAKRQ